VGGDTVGPVQRVDGDLLVSATDLTRFLACRHLTRLDLEVARGERAAPVEADDGLEVLRHRGLAHEAAYVAALRGRGLRVVEITAADRIHGREALRAAEEVTVAAMADGADVVYQATLVDGAWRGHADLLLRRPDRPGRWGWSYDVADVKLARRLTVAAVLQMACYAERLTVVQGTPPELLVAVTGDGSERAYRYDRCAAYARRARADLLAFVADPPPTVPEPVRHCAQCRWQPACRARWRAEDRITLVAGLRQREARALQAVGVTTLGDLAASDPAALADVLGAAPADRLQAQARLQARERSGAGPQHRVLPPEPGRGLALLPPPSPGDVFFDIEGDPYAGDGGLEYLFGVLGPQGYVPFWATRPQDERTAFEALVDHLTRAWQDDPGMHVYHYAPYEPTRLRRLAGRYDTRVEEVRRLLAGGRLVDLYPIVKQGVQVGKESYSLKRLEDHYWGHGRDGAPVADAMGSVVAFERWLLRGAHPDDPALESLRSYNEEDCRSTAALRDWLEALRAGSGGDAVRPRPVPPPPVPPYAGPAPDDPLLAALADLAARGDRAPAGEGARAVEVHRLLHALLGWSRREAMAPPVRLPDGDGSPVGEPDDVLLAGRLRELAARVAELGPQAVEGPWAASRDLLLRRTPSPPEAVAVRAGERAEDAVLRWAHVVAPDGRPAPGVLPVQAPAGTGGPALAAALVRRAVAEGRRAGLCGPTTAEVAAVQRALPPGTPVVAGLPARLADPALEDRLDLLVVVGADRMPLAHALAAAGAARRVVLLGDPCRRPGRRGGGVHPPGAGIDALDHLLAGAGRRATPVPGEGVLLDVVSRAHPDVVRFVSELSYDGRLRAAPGSEHLAVRSAGPLHGAGLRWVPVPDGTDPVDAVAALAGALLADGSWTDHRDVRRRLGPDDVLVLVPRDGDHARALRRRLSAAVGVGPDGGPGVRVEAVDAAAGLRAPVVLLDLTGGVPGRPSAEEAPSRERLTVALSRAGALVAVLADPALLGAEPRTPEQLQRLDALHRYGEEATTVAAPEPGDALRAEVTGTGR